MKPLDAIPSLAVVLGAAIITGCASEPAAPTVADRMRGHAAEVQQEADLKGSLAKQWERGSKLVATGSRRVEEGEQRLQAAKREQEKAREQIERGRSEMREGRELVEDAEQRFQQQFPGLELR